MTITRFVSIAVIASFLMAALPKAVWAAEEGSSSVSVDLRAAIDRAAAQFLTESREPSTSLPTSRPVVNARQSAGGGGGGTGMMIWTVVGTVTSLAATYFVIKEVRKQTDKAIRQQQ
jgi:hypothetical protein